MPSDKTDICIVGGGPAGLCLALLLLKSGVRVTLLEKSGSLDNREYRGEILQPGGLALLDRLGVLGPARARGGYEHDRFRVVDRNRVLLDADYRRLPEPYNFLLSLPQPHLLGALLDACLAFDGFVHLPGTRVTALLREGERVAGVRADGPGGEYEVEAHCVVGADGRYSKVRRLAGIEGARVEAFDQDVLWFKVPVAQTGGSRSVQVYRSAGSPVLMYHCHPGSMQFGWTLPHGGYRAVADRGIGYVLDEITRAVPPYAPEIRGHINALTDLTLLDVFSGQAETWTADGLVLIGDSAHTHGPIGAQGINLAVQDAVLLHPVLLDSLRTRDAAASVLSRFERERRPAVDGVLKLQAMQGKAMLSRNPVADAVRPVLSRAVAHTPVYRKILTRIAYGSVPIRVRDELFSAA